MKIKLSKSQWEMVGRKAGWMKTAQNTPQAEKYMQTVKNNITNKYMSLSVDELKTSILPTLETNVKNYKTKYNELLQKNWVFGPFGKIQEIFPTPESYLAVPTMIRDIALEVLKGKEQQPQQPQQPQM